MIENKGTITFSLMSVAKFTGVGFGLLGMTGYLSVKEHFEDKFSLMVSVACLFEFVGIAILPLILQYLRDLFGDKNALIIFGAALWNLVTAGVGYKPVQRVTKGTRVTTDSIDRKTVCSKVNYLEENNVNTQDKRVTKFLEKYFLSFLTLFLHDNFMVFLIIECVMYFIFISWALFLVSLGTSTGLSTEQAVLLSTYGGIGGFFGKVVAVVLFHFDKMDAYTSSLIPLSLNSVCLFGCGLIRNFYILAALTFLSGLCQGVNSSGLFGLLPSMVCRYHLPQAAAISAVLEGIVVQLGGFISGMTNFILTNDLLYRSLKKISAKHLGRYYISSLKRFCM